MTFEQFQASRVYTTDLNGFGDELDGCKGFTYDDNSYWIQDVSDKPIDGCTWYLPLCNCEYTSNDLGELEKIIYDWVYTSAE